MNPVGLVEKELQLHWVRVCDKEIEKMGKEAKKKQDDAKNESSNSNSNSTSSRRHVVDNASHVSVRKSQRLESRTAAAAGSTPSKAKTPNKPQTSSPLRRSGRENKFQSPSSTLLSSKSPVPKHKSKDKDKDKGKHNDKDKDKDKDKHNDNDNDRHKASTDVAPNAKKRLSARHYKHMFKPMKKKIKVSDSHAGPNTDSDTAKQVQQDSSENADVVTPASDSDLMKLCESEAAELSLPLDVSMPSPVTKATNNQLEHMESGRSDQEGHLTSNDAPVVGSEDVGKSSKDVVPSTSSSCKLISLTEQCDKCFRKRRLEYNALKQELCCCLPNWTDDVHMISVSKDRGEYGTLVSTQHANKHGQYSSQSEPAVDAEGRTCFTCKSTGVLMHCIGKGCRRSYHASCLLTPEEYVSLPMWYCCECTRKRLNFGVHSVSEGIESIWDVREVELSNSTEKQKQYFVKYKGLAHIHNHWIPEIQLRQEVPELLAAFDEREEGMHWKPEWVVPHRLLKKRFVRLLNADEDNDPVPVVSNGQYEWLVKWCALDYDQATWEFEDTCCFDKVVMQRLRGEHEARHERARTSLSRGNEIQERRKGSHAKTGRLSVGGGVGADSCYMNSVNKLEREYYHKRQNAVLLGEQDRIVKVVYLVSSIVMNAPRPVLIISPNALLSVWEAEFLRLAASINVVVYAGNRDARNIIRSLEFYEGGNVMLQVLLSCTEVVSEDLNVLKDVHWEAVIVDDCQQSCVMEHRGSIKNLVTEWRLLLVNAQLKEHVADYINILSLLESGDDPNQDSGLLVDTSASMNVLKDRLSQFITCARFLECWVPVQLSNLQLEQYCSLILSNRSALLSSSRSDPVGSLRDILISTRKCCDHPYILDSSLQSSLTGRLPMSTLDAVLDLGTRASGKLTLVDEVLSELRNQELKVLILFQSIGGSGRDSKGDILDDYLSFRFGPDSYEHVDSGCLTSKKHAAVNRFNKEKERSFFLLETRACLPSIKLSSVDAVIILDSDWNPLNDMRALQRITIDSKLEQIKVFRLYCACTIEEKVLILAKNDMILDSNLQGISPSTSHMLLMWGSSYLFSRLDEFHRDKVVDFMDNIMPENGFMKQVCEEILSFVRNQGTMNSSKFISVARQTGGGYLKNVTLIGEEMIQLEEALPSHLFWMKLLEGKQPQWRYLSGSSQRNRKRVHYQELGDQGNEATKKSRKMERNKAESCQQPAKNMEKTNAWKNESLGIAATNDLEAVTNTNPASHDNNGKTSPTVVNDIPGPLQVNCVEHDPRKNLHNEQLGLFQLLKPAISRLCVILHIKDAGKRLAEQFLEYVLKHHRVMAEPEAILQAFQISVCWTAAEALNHKMDHKKSLDIAREKMNFNCREEEAEAIYSKTKMFMKIFMRRSGVFKIPNAFNGPVLATSGFINSPKEHGIELEGSSVLLDGFDEQILSLMQTTDNKNDILRYVKKVKKKCDKQLERLNDKHSDELEKFEKECYEKRAELEKKYKMESAIICSIHGKSSVGIEKLKIMDKNCAKEREDLELKISNWRKELEDRQQTERDDEQKKTASLLEQVKSLVPNDLLDNPSSENAKQAAELIDKAPSNPRASIMTDGMDMGELNITSEKVSDVPGLAADGQRVNHQNDASINSSKELPLSEETGVNNMAQEVPQFADLLKTQAEPFAETVSGNCGQGDPREQPHSPENFLVEPLEVDRSTVLETYQENEAIASLSPEPLPSPGISVAQQPVAGPAAEAPSANQAINDESRRGMADETEQQVQHVTGMLNVSSEGEMVSLGCSDPMPCHLLPSAGLSGLPAADNSLYESAAFAHADDQLRVAVSSRPDDQSEEIRTSGSRPLQELAVDHPVNASLGQFDSHISTRGALPPRASRPNPQVPIFSISRSSDPLQNEVERIHKEIDQVITSHEEMKLRLISERDKEIEEIVAQIRKKYEEKLDEAETSFVLKRNELQMNQNKVMMHKILAEAFRSKCMDYKAASGMQQAITSRSMEHVSQMHAANTTSSSGLASANLAPISPHSAGPTPLAVQPSLGIASNPATRRQVEPLPLASGVQVRSTIRGPAPHLQSFRSASLPISTGYTSVSCGVTDVSIQQPQLNKSSSTPQFPSRTPSQLPVVINSDDQSHKARNDGSISAPLSVSATDLLLENGQQNERSVSCLGASGPLLPDNVQNSGSQDAHLETTTNLQMPSSSLGVGNIVVCLSDED